MLQGFDEVGVVTHSFFVSIEFVLHLLLEDAFLEFRVVQFCEGVADFHRVDENFEAFS
jgi:hypothetical protein